MFRIFSLYFLRIYCDAILQKIKKTTCVYYKVLNGCRARGRRSPQRLQYVKLRNYRHFRSFFFFPFFNNRVDSFSQAACVSQSLLARPGAKRKNIIILTTAFVHARLSFASLLR